MIMRIRGLCSRSFWIKKMESCPAPTNHQTWVVCVLDQIKLVPLVVSSTNRLIQEHPIWIIWRRLQSSDSIRRFKWNGNLCDSAAKSHRWTKEDLSVHQSRRRVECYLLRTTRESELRLWKNKRKGLTLILKSRISLQLAKAAVATSPEATSTAQTTT